MSIWKELLYALGVKSRPYVYMPDIKAKILEEASRWDWRVQMWINITPEERSHLACDLDFMMNWRCKEVPEGQEWFKTPHGCVVVRTVEL